MRALNEHWGEVHMEWSWLANVSIPAMWVRMKVNLPVPVKSSNEYRQLMTTAYGQQQTRIAQPSKPFPSSWGTEIVNDTEWLLFLFATKLWGEEEKDEEEGKEVKEEIKIRTVVVCKIIQL